MSAGEALIELAELRKRAPYTWAATSTYAQLAHRLVTGDPLEVGNIAAVSRLIDIYAAGSERTA